MPFSFVFYGIVLIFLLFFVSKKNKKTFMFLGGLVGFLLSFFVGKIVFQERVEINLLSILAILLIVFALALCIQKNDFLKVVSLVVFSSSIYFVICNINIYLCNVFWIVPFIIILFVCSAFCRFDAVETILFVLLSTIMCEILNAVIMAHHINYLALFGANMHLCIVVAMLPCLVLKLVFVLLKGRRYEKSI